MHHKLGIGFHMAAKGKLIIIALIWVVAVGAIGATVLFAYGTALNSQPKTVSLAPTLTPIPTSTPIFTVTLSPSSQTVVQELSQTINFDVTIAGSANYPCAIIFHSAAMSDYDLYLQFGLSDSYTTTVSSYHISGGFLYMVSNGLGTYGLYVTVIDSQGNSYNSNLVTVTVK